jgi:hypothetical protein
MQTGFLLIVLLLLFLTIWFFLSNRFAVYTPENELLKDSECRAQNPATCRTHGTAPAYTSTDYEALAKKVKPERIATITSGEGKGLISLEEGISIQERPKNNPPYKK